MVFGPLYKKKSQVDYDGVENIVKDHITYLDHSGVESVVMETDSETSNKTRLLKTS